VDLELVELCQRNPYYERNLWTMKPKSDYGLTPTDNALVFFDIVGICFTFLSLLVVGPNYIDEKSIKIIYVFGWGAVGERDRMEWFHS
jgi:hypothetical protein